MHILMKKLLRHRLLPANISIFIVNMKAIYDNKVGLFNSMNVK